MCARWLCGFVARVVLKPALTMLLSASLGCSALLDLEYEYRDEDSGPVDGGTDTGADATVDASSDASVDTNLDGAEPDVGPSDCLPEAAGLSLTMPTVLFDNRTEDRLLDPFEKVQVFSDDSRLFMSRRLPDGDYEVRDMLNPDTPLSVNQFLSDVGRVNDCISEGSLSDLHIQHSGAVAAIVDASATQFTLEHLSADGETCSRVTHDGSAQGFLRANNTVAFTKRSTNSIAFAGTRDRTDGYASVFAQDASPGIHVVLNEDGGGRNVDYQRGGRPAENRYPVEGEFTAPAVIVEVGVSGFAVFYGVDDRLQRDVVTTGFLRTDSESLAGIGDLFGVASQRSATAPLLVVAKDAMRPTIVRMYVMDGVAGGMDEVTSHEMPDTVDAIDVTFNADVFTIGLGSLDGTTRVLTTRMCLES